MNFSRSFSFYKIIILDNEEEIIIKMKFRNGHSTDKITREEINFILLSIKDYDGPIIENNEKRFNGCSGGIMISFNKSNINLLSYNIQFITHITHEDIVYKTINFLYNNTKEVIFLFPFTKKSYIQYYFLKNISINNIIKFTYINDIFIKDYFHLFCPLNILKKVYERNRLYHLSDRYSRYTLFPSNSYCYTSYPPDEVNDLDKRLIFFQKISYNLKGIAEILHPKYYNFLVRNVEKNDIVRLINKSEYTSEKCTNSFEITEFSSLTFDNKNSEYLKLFSKMLEREKFYEDEISSYE